MLPVIGIALKPLFSDTIMQWCFSYNTMMNIYVAVVFLSYMFCDVFPRPIYGNAYLRLILLSVFVLVFHKWVSRLYRNVLDYWHIYILPVASMLACFLSYFFCGDIKETMASNYIPLLFVILLGLSVYVSIIHSLKTENAVRAGASAAGREQYGQVPEAHGGGFGPEQPRRT
ncbi:hypothetical protein SDC9_133847 [bioreactor metagenome]|uniref:Uncharacterized protein n=1 Tax=bioreactor metagenome TaxID=1076179 RepID=A0A645DC40_9ZZZZ